MCEGQDVRGVAVGAGEGTIERPVDGHSHHVAVARAEGRGGRRVMREGRRLDIHRCATFRAAHWRDPHVHCQCPRVLQRMREREAETVRRESRHLHSMDEQGGGEAIRSILSFRLVLSVRGLVQQGGSRAVGRRWPAAGDGRPRAAERRECRDR